MHLSTSPVKSSCCTLKKLEKSFFSKKPSYVQMQLQLESSRIVKLGLLFTDDKLFPVAFLKVRKIHFGCITTKRHNMSAGSISDCVNIS